MSVRVRRAAMALAGLCFITTVAIAVTGMAGCWSPRRSTELLCALLLSACITGIMAVTAVLSHILSPLAASYGLGTRSALRTAREMPPPRGRHARELAPNRDGSPELLGRVFEFRRLVI